MRELPDWAARYVGLHYVPGGRSIDGVDCWGLVTLVWREQMGASIPEYDGPDWHGKAATAFDIGAVAREFAGRFQPVQPGAERAMDGVLLRMLTQPMHVGLVVAPGLMLHIEEGAGSVIEDYTTMRWKRRVLGIYRHEGEDG